MTINTRVVKQAELKPVPQIGYNFGGVQDTKAITIRRLSPANTTPGKFVATEPISQIYLQ